MFLTHRIPLRTLVLPWILASLSTSGCASQAAQEIASSTPTLAFDSAGHNDEREVVRKMELVSDAFQEGEAIPERYTCDGENVSPQLAWRNPPAGSTHLVLTIEDPDAPGQTWVHWLVFNIPVGLGQLDAGAGSDPSLRGSGATGVNSWGETSYGGPCPPTGTHRYFIRLYAIDEALEFTSPPLSTQLHQAMSGHILAEASLLGIYSREE